MSETPAHLVHPHVHRVASLLKRWLLGTHQGAVTDQHLNAYLDVLLSSVEASATSKGGHNRQWWNGSLELNATHPSPRFLAFASG